MGGGEELFMTRTDFKKTVNVVLKCGECSSVQTIRRRKCRRKKQGHKKTLYCIKCQKKTEHIELGIE